MMYNLRSLIRGVGTYPCSVFVKGKNVPLQLPNSSHYSTGFLESISRQSSAIFQTLSESTLVEYSQNMLLNVHHITGAPWWLSIVCSTVLLRTAVTFPLTIYQQHIMARLQNIREEFPSVVDELKRETSMAVTLYKWDEKTAKAQYYKSLRKQWNNLVIRDNCHPFKVTIVAWFQIPMWIGFSIGFRNLVYMLPRRDLDAHLTYLQLSEEGFGWITNLTQIDSTFVLPLTFCLINLTIIEIQAMSKQGVPTKLQKYLTNFFRGLSIFMLPVAATVPSCLVLYWTTSSLYGLLQHILLMSPKFRRICRIPTTSTELKNPYKHLYNNLGKKFRFLPS